MSSRTTSSNPFRKLAIRVVAVCCGVLAGLAVVELTLIIVDQPRFYKGHSLPRQFYGTGETIAGIPVYVNQPGGFYFVYDGNPRNYFGRNNEVVHKVNSDGFRGGEHPNEKPAETLRLAFFGDSFTFGEGVRFEDTYPEVTRRLLQHVAGDQSQTVEAMNFGVGGYNTVQALHLLKTVGLEASPDCVVLGYVLNDPEPPLFQFDKTAQEIVRTPRENEVSEGMNDPVPPGGFPYQLRTAQWLWKTVQKSNQRNQTVAYYQSLFNPSFAGWQHSQAALQEFIATCHSRKIPCVIVLFPLLTELNENYPFHNAHAMIAREVTGTPAIFVDLFPLLKGRNADSLWVHPTDSHPNEVVHRIAAEAIVKALLDDRLVEVAP